MLGWSYSRYSTFQSCKRQYYYEKYAKYDVAGDLIQTRKLAQLTTVPLEIGNISHKILRTLLKRLQKTSAEIDPERFFDYAHREAFAIFRSKLFDEVYYGVRDEIDFENEIYEVTGGQPIPGRGRANFAAMAKGAGFPHTFEFVEQSAFETELPNILKLDGPVFVTVKASPSGKPLSTKAPPIREAARRFRESLTTVRR